MPSPDSNNHINVGRAVEDAAGDDVAVRDGHAEDLSGMVEDARTELAAVVAEMKRIIGERAALAKEGAEAAGDMARDTIRTYPVASIAASAALGAVIAIALTATRTPSRPRIASSLRDLSTADMSDWSKQMQRSATSTGSSLLSSLEKVVESVSTIDPKSSLAPTIEKAAGWLGSLKDSISSRK